MRKLGSPCRGSCGILGMSADFSLRNNLFCLSRIELNLNLHLNDRKRKRKEKLFWKCEDLNCIVWKCIAKRAGMTSITVVGIYPL